MKEFAIFTGMHGVDGKKLFLANNDGVMTATKDEFLTFDNEWKLVDFLESKCKAMRKSAWRNGWHYSLKALSTDSAISKDAMDIIRSFMDNANLTQEKMERERVKRLKELKLEGLILQEAIKNKTMVISEGMGLPWGVNYVLHGYTYEDEVRKAMKKVEEIDGLPYFAIVNHLRDGGLWVSVLFVSAEKEYWEEEHMDENGYIFAGVYSTQLDSIDWGMIGIKPAGGGVVRIK